MNNRLSQNFNVFSLLKFAAPTTIMLVFMSLYQMVDGVFVSRFIGDTALSALNIIYPVPSIIIAVAIMLATGGNAIIAKNMGEGKYQEAKENFSMLTLIGLVFGILFLVFGLVFIKPIIQILGATDKLYPYCYDYLFVMIVATPLAVLQMLFQSYFVTAGKPHIGLILTVIGGVSNVVLDYVFIVIFKIGILGAAVATSLGYAIPAIFGLFYFTINKSGTLYFVKPKLRKDVIIKSCTNGSSEMVNNLAIAVTTYMFNILTLKYAGENGVAAITIVLYAQFLLTSVFMGFSSGVAPIFSYNYGKQNHHQLHRLLKMSMWFVIITSLIVFMISFTCSDMIISVFASKESPVFAMTQHGFIIFGFSFLFTGLNIFASALFTSLSNGKVSACLSFLRTFVFLVISLIVLPYVLGLDGIWLSVPLAECIACFVSIYYLIKNKNIYHY